MGRIKTRPFDVRQAMTERPFCKKAFKVNFSHEPVAPVLTALVNSEFNSKLASGFSVSLPGSLEGKARCNMK